MRDKCKVSTSYDYVLSYGIHGQGTLDKLGKKKSGHVQVVRTEHYIFVVPSTPHCLSLLDHPKSSSSLLRTFLLLLIKMLFTTISLIAAFAGIATALPPLTDGTHLEIGPLPYAELKAQVEAIHASNKRDVLTKRTTEGVYLCDGLNFSGNCYWGAYPIGLC